MTAAVEGVTEVKALETFHQALKDADGDLVVVHFWTAWAPQCQQVDDILKELSNDTKYVQVKFFKVEAEDLPELSLKYEVIAVPTCILIRNGKAVDRIDGANIPQLAKKVAAQVDQGYNVPTFSQPAPKEDLNNRLKKLISLQPVMIFIKGSPAQPKCGFSKQLLQILDEKQVKYGSFDILEDEDVRQGLKTYSNWPTFPQMYVNGELIGGLDIVREMAASGELWEMLPQKENLDERLKSLINKEPVMVFMKGSPTEPKCGFSKTLVGILGETGVKYGTFDILQDEEVRQGLKTYSNWPTYPQIYVKGELIGGVDIIKELNASGELKATLTGQ